MKPPATDAERAALRAAAAAVRDALRPGAEPFDGDRLDRRDAGLIAATLPAFARFNRDYLKLRVRGLEHVPRGPALYVANHNGGIAGPDLAATLGTLWSARGPDAPLFALAHDFAMRQLPPLGRLVQRFGGVRAAPENAVRALAQGAQMLVYPGGDLDAFRHTRRRDEVVFGPRSGFVRVAQRADVPVVPIVAHGAHRSALIVAEGARLAQLARAPKWGRVARLPVALALPWGVAVGPWWPYFPLPFPVQLAILPPMRFAQHEPAEHGRDRVQSAMQAALDALARGAR